MVYDNFVLLESFQTVHDAHLAASALKAVDIHAKISNEAAMSTLPHLGLALGGVKLLVREEDFEEAARIIRGETDLADQPYREPGDDSSYDDEEDGYQENGDEPEHAATRAFRTSVIGLLLCPGLLHVYSLTLLLQLPARGEALSKRAAKQARIAWAINIVVLVLVLFGVVTYFNR